MSGGKDRLKTIAESSGQRGDSIHTQIEDGLQDESLKNLQFHMVCVSSYTSKQYIKTCSEEEKWTISNN